jgi:hypothetical protein
VVVDVVVPATGAVRVDLRFLEERSPGHGLFFAYSLRGHEQTILPCSVGAEEGPSLVMGPSSQSPRSPQGVKLADRDPRLRGIRANPETLRRGGGRADAQDGLHPKREARTSE